MVSSGVGFVLVQGQSNMSPEIVMSAMLAVGMVGLLIDVALARCGAARAAALGPDRRL